MQAAKTETLTVRVEPAAKAGLKAMAEPGRRSLVNIIEVMIRDYCWRHGIAIPDQQDPIEDGRTP